MKKEKTTKTKVTKSKKLPVVTNTVTLESFSTQPTNELNEQRKHAASKLKAWGTKMEKDKVKATIQFATEIEGIGMVATGIDSLDFLLGGHGGKTDGGIPTGVHSILGGKLDQLKQL